MNVNALSVSRTAAAIALEQYKQHRANYDKRDWEIERIYRAIAKGKTVISIIDSIRTAGFDEKNRPKLAIGRADDPIALCRVDTGKVTYSPTSRYSQRAFEIPWPEARYDHRNYALRAEAPRIPPQHRPDVANLHKYHLLWEADWTEIPRDPFLLKRLGKDAWLVCAAWDLTDVEISVIRSHREHGHT